jgi:hypothetical protein
MNRLPKSILAFSLALACSSAVHAGKQRTANDGSSCPYGVSLGDGCESASSSTTGSVQHPDFFTAYGPQNGQSYVSATFTGTVNGTSLVVPGLTQIMVAGISAGNTLTGAGVPRGCAIASGGPTTWTLNQNCGSHSGPMSTMVRPPWNVAAVEYPVGAQVASLRPMAITGGNGCPAGITGNAGPTCSTGALATFGYWTIDAHNGGLSISGIDFSANGGGGIDIHNVRGAFTITNSQLLANVTNIMSSGRWGAGSGGANGLISFDTGNAITSMLFDHLTMDGYANNGDCCRPTLMATIMNSNPLNPLASPTAPVILQYSDLENFNTRFNFPCGGTMMYNFLHNENYNSGFHGEWTTFGSAIQGVGGDCSNVDIEYNTILQDSNFFAGETAAIYVSDGLRGVVANFPQTTIKNNTYIGNAAAVTVTAVSGSRITIVSPTACIGAASFIKWGTSVLKLSAYFRSFVGAAPANECGGAGTGTWNFVGPAPLGPFPQTIYIAGGGAGSQGILASLAAQTFGNIDCENNYVDPSGALSGSLGTSKMACFLDSSHSGSFTNIGNINMNRNAQAN